MNTADANLGAQLGEPKIMNFPRSSGLVFDLARFITLQEGALYVESCFCPRRQPTPEQEFTLSLTLRSLRLPLLWNEVGIGQPAMSQPGTLVNPDFRLRAE